MKVRITFKDPDAVSGALDDACALFPPLPDGVFTEAERKAMHAAGQYTRREELNKAFANWFEMLEYVTLELDTDEDTCVVVPNRTAKLVPTPLAAQVAELQALLETEREHSKSLRAECAGLHAVIDGTFNPDAWPQQGPVRAAYLRLREERQLSRPE